MKKILSVLLIAVMIFGSMSTVSFAHEVTTTWQTPFNATAIYEGYDGAAYPARSGVHYGYYEDGKLRLYFKFDISAYKDENVDTARLIFHSFTNDVTVSLYAIPEADWSDTTAPTVDTSEANKITTSAKPNGNGSSTLDNLPSTDSLTYTQNTQYIITDYVKELLAAGKTTCCFALVGQSGFTRRDVKGTNDTVNLNQKPALQIATSTVNNTPTVELSAQATENINFEEDVVITAAGSDADNDALTYEFTLDDNAVDASAVDDNVLTLTGLTAGIHTIKVTCTDEHNATATDELTISGYTSGSDEPVVTWQTPFNAAAIYEGYDGEAYPVRTGVHYGYDEDDKIRLYFKFDISAYKDENVDTARLIFRSFTSDVLLSLYAIPEADWSDTTAPTVDTSEANKITTSAKPNGNGSSTLDNLPSTDSLTYTQNTQYIITDYVKELLAAGKTTCYFALVGQSGFTKREIKATNDANLNEKPALQIATTTNNMPKVELTTAATEGVNFDEDVVITANGSDPDEHEISYTFYVDGKETAATGNVLTLSDLEPGSHTIKVVCTDAYGGYSTDEITISGYTESFEDQAMQYIENAAVGSADSGGVIQSNGVGLGGNQYNYQADHDTYFMVRFPMSDISKYDVKSADLVFWGGSGDSGATQVNVYKVSDNSWTVDSTAPEFNENNYLATYTYSDAVNTTTDETLRINWRLNLTDLVKQYAENGEEYFNVAIRVNAGYLVCSTDRSNRPRLAYVVNNNNRPTIAITSPAAAVGVGDVNFTANITDAEGGLDSSSVKLYLDGTELTGVTNSGSDYSAQITLTRGEHELKAVAADMTGCKRTAVKTITADIAYASAALTGTIASEGTLTANYSVKNLSSTEALTFDVYIAVYAAGGDLYDVALSTVTLQAGEEIANEVFTLNLDETTLDLTNYTASAMIWSEDMISLMDSVDLQ